MSKYEIINPSDECFIYADDVRLAKIACAYLGSGYYGLRDENGEAIMHPFEDIETATEMKESEIKKFIDDNKIALAKVFRSFEYKGERTSLNNIGARAEQIAEAMEGGQNNGI